jgi:hypothetical protein
MRIQAGECVPFDTRSGLRLTPTAKDGAILFDSRFDQPPAEPDRRREETTMSTLLIILIILLVLALAGGGWGYGRYGAVSLSPLGIIIIILLLLWLTGNLNL